MTIEPGSGESPSLPICCQYVLKAASRNRCLAIQHITDDTRDFSETNSPIEKRVDSHFVGRIEHRRTGTARLRGVSGEA